MTDTEHGFEPKWTPGPWTASYNGIFMGGGGEFALGSPNVMSGRYRRKVDVELASLAPELAAAVLAWYALDVRWQDWDELEDLKRLAERLRMIGADE